MRNPSAPDYSHIEKLPAVSYPASALQEYGLDMGLPSDEIVGVLLPELELQIAGHVVELNDQQCGKLRSLLADKFY